MDTTPRVDGHTSLPSDTRTNSGVSSLDPTVVNLLRNNFGFSLGAKNLDSHSADASGPQGSRSAPAQKSEFQSLIEEAKKYEGRQIGNFNIEVAKQDFSQISNKSDFFRAAFRAIALPGNEAEVANNIKHLLRLSQGNITIELIIDEFKNIGDVDRRIEFLDKLKVNLSGEEKTEFKDFLTGALDGVADQIADEFEKSQNKDKAALFEKLKSVDLLKIALLAEEKVGVPFLARLINDNKLPSLELAELDLQTLQQLDFAKLLQEKLAELVVDLISSDPPQSDKLLQLIDDQKILLDVFRALPELSLDQSIKIVCILLEHGADGVNCLVGLINDKKLPLDVFPALPVLSQSQSINIVCVLLKCGSEGLNYLADLINNGKLPNLSMGDSSASKKFNCYLLARGQSGLAVVKALIGKGKLDPKQFKEQDAKEFAGALFMNGSSGADYAIDLINMSMLPNFSLVDSSESKKFARYFLSQGAPGLGAIKTLVEEKKLDPTKFSPEDAKEFVDALFMNGSSGADYAIDLINMSMLPNLASQDAVSAHVSMLQTLQSTLKGGITKAFPGGTRARDLTLAKARGIWPTIANEVAASCFGTNGEVDIDKLKGWTVLLGDEEIFKTEPYCLIPHAELMRSQMYTACESLLNNKNKERDLLNAAKGIRVGQHGRAILDTMSNGRTQSLTPPVAILSSLFTPHRQKSLPTCTINSLINAEIRNHPEQLIKMYRQMLEGEQFTLPSGYAIRQQEIAGGFITVDLKNGWDGKDLVFRDITSGDHDRVEKRKDLWQAEGITYPGSGNAEDKYKLRLPVHNMNDILFAHFFQASDFGKEDIDDDCSFGTILLYAGHKECSKAYLPEINVVGANFLDVMTKLKKYAEEQQQQLGHHYMRVSTTASGGAIIDGNDHSGHSENIDINALLAIDLNNMETERAYPIGDRNWSGGDVSYDIPRLAIRKVDNTPTYEFGTLWDGSRFEKTDMEQFEVYTTNIDRHAALHQREPFSFRNFFKAPIGLFIDIMKCFYKLFKALVFKS